MSSATDVTVKGGKAPEERAPNDQVTTKKRRSNPVALEVPVSVAGARPATARDKRDLFSEETHTVLVFKDGAVIQLSAAITIGQLLFLTEKKTKREVVCQVVHKRSHRPTACYVELEFTEEAEDFWGVSFPASDERAQIPAEAEAVQAEEPTEDDPSEPVAAPKSEDVAQLKDEVEALRAQLRELKGKQAAEEREAQARKLAEEETSARAAAETEARQKAEEQARKKAARAETEKAQAEAEKTPGPAAEVLQKAEEKPVQNAEVGVKKQEEPAAVEKEAAPPPAKRIGMRLPTAGPPNAGLPQVWTGASPGEAATEKSEIDPLEDLLPRPAQDFSKAKGLDPNDPYNIYKPLRKKAGLREILAAVVLLMALIGGGALAWYENWLPFLHRASKMSEVQSGLAAANSAKTNSAATETNASAVPGTVNAHPATATEAPGKVLTNSLGSAPPVAETKPEASARTSKPPAEKSAEFGKAAKNSAVDEHAARKNAASAKPETAKASKNHGKAETSAESKPQPAAGDVASDAPVLPAKLVRPVQPVYPPDAMRGYIAGDVRIEADVDAQGHVSAMKVLLGPAALRQAAIDALKQYEYAPATQGGKPVASKVTVTVKFWFDP